MAKYFRNLGRSQYLDKLLILHINKTCFMKISLGLSHQAAGANKQNPTLMVGFFLFQNTVKIIS